jgi:hypothetical protein
VVGRLDAEAIEELAKTSTNKRLQVILDPRSIQATHTIQMDKQKDLPSGLPTPSQTGGGESPEEAAKRAAAEEQMRRDILATVLDTAARERCTDHSLLAPH